MSKIKISIKMTIWYTILTVALLAIFIPVLYTLISQTLYKVEQEKIFSLMSREIDNISEMINSKGSKDYLAVQFEINTYSVYRDKALNINFTNIENETDKWLEDEAFNVVGEPRIVEKTGKRWLILDFDNSAMSEDFSYIRICRSLEDMDNAINQLKIIILVVVPLYLLITILGGLLISKRALRPIKKISNTAKEIGNGDLSLRIKDIESKDEVGELAEIFNSMIEKLEGSINKEKRFSSDASHELRIPTSVIMAYAESMLDELKDKEDKIEFAKSIGIIHKESKRISNIISQLLTITRGYEGKYVPVFEEINIDEIIEGVLEQLKPKAEEKKIKLKKEISEDVIITADQSLITQMMLNLVENAIKYGKDGGNVEVTAKHDGEKVKITVIDDGIGIPRENCPHIFERFYRVDQSRDRSGSGLGLSIVKWIVEEHKGSIRVESSENEGTKFEIEL